MLGGIATWLLESRRTSARRPVGAVTRRNILTSGFRQSAPPRGATAALRALAPRLVSQLSPLCYNRGTDTPRGTCTCTARDRYMCRCRPVTMFYLDLLLHLPAVPVVLPRRAGRYATIRTQQCRDTSDVHLLHRPQTFPFRTYWRDTAPTVLARNRLYVRLYLLSLSYYLIFILLVPYHQILKSRRDA